MKDELGRRIKAHYEDALRVSLPGQCYAVIRIDGKKFHTFSARLPRPYCRPLANALDAAALHLCREIPGCAFAYGQSDEYSLLLTDFHTPMWFDGNIQKIASVSASLFTAVFNASFDRAGLSAPPFAAFDARVLAIPRRDEVAKYFIWRQLDATANSLNMLAGAHYSHAELLGKTDAEKHDLLHAKGLNWAHEPADFKRGRVVRRDADQWRVDHEPAIFTRDASYLDALIPS